MITEDDVNTTEVQIFFCRRWSEDFDKTPREQAVERVLNLYRPADRDGLRRLLMARGRAMMSAARRIANYHPSYKQMRRLKNPLPATKGKGKSKELPRILQEKRTQTDFHNLLDEKFGRKRPS